MRHEFVQEVPVAIDPGPPSTIQSTLEVTGLAGATIEEVEVTIDITHTWVGDLVVDLIGPDGEVLRLLGIRGGVHPLGG